VCVIDNLHTGPSADLLPLRCCHIVGLGLDGEQRTDALDEPSHGMLGALGLGQRFFSLGRGFLSA